jgi:hypothetical protein
MMQKIKLWVLAAILICGASAFTACSSNDNPVVAPVAPVVQHEAWTQELIDALNQNPEAKGLLVKAIDIAKSINSNHDTNPAQTLDEYYDYLDWSAKCLPWSIIPQPVGRTLYDKIDYGLVAMLPIGMSQISSINFDETLKVGDKVKKGDHLGWFLFGGSDIVYLFQKGITFNLATTNHLLQGEKLGSLQQSDGK